MERALDVRRTKWRFLWPGPFVYLVITGGFPSAAVMLALLLVGLTIKQLAETRIFLSVFPLAFGTLLGFGLSSPAWVAFVDSFRVSALELLPGSALSNW